MLLMLVGIGFIAVLTASVASVFVKTDRQEERAEGQEERAEIAERLTQIERDLSELKAGLLGR